MPLLRAINISPNIARAVEESCVLAYDIGMHNGDDTAYYLAKGFRVVAVEADCHVAGTEHLVKIRNDDHSGPSRALNVEAVLALAPDLVIAKEDLRPALATRGLPVFWVPSRSDLATIADTVVALGERIGAGDAARAVHDGADAGGRGGDGSAERSQARRVEPQQGSNWHSG